MIRETSIEAFNSIRENGLLSQRRWEVYETIFLHGPLTASQVFRKLHLPTNQSGRITELSDMGLLKELGTTTCPVTGNTAILWDVTDRIKPLPLNVKGISKKQKIHSIIRKIDEIKSLVPAMYSQLVSDLTEEVKSI